MVILIPHRQRVQHRPAMVRHCLLDKNAAQVPICKIEIGNAGDGQAVSQRRKSCQKAHPQHCRIARDFIISVLLRSS